MTNGHRGPVTVAAVQASYVLMDTQACLAKAIDLLGQAADLGARIVVFPEVFIPGTPIWIDSQRIWEGDEEWYALLVDQAVLVPGPVTDALGAAARDAGVFLVIGVDEREPSRHDDLQHHAVLRAGRQPARQTPEADAHRIRTDRVGHG